MFMDDKHDRQIDRPSDCKTEANEGIASDDQVNTEQLSSSSPRSASGESGETLQSELYYDDLKRGSTFNPVSFNLNYERIKGLEQLETILAKGYGKHGPDTDSDIRRHFTNSRVSDVSLLSGARKSSTHVDVSRFWALIIGIDTYSDMPLKGCVSDALSIKEYITKDLGVPQDHVFCLINESATRANIIRALCDLYSDTRILYNDIIIVYFAGHGSSYPDPNIWSDGADHAIEAICSIDRGTEHNGTLIPDISDREFNSILSLISRAKGHRITVLLDCCHSGSHSRYNVLEGVRTIPPLKHDSATYMLRVAHDNMRRYPGYRSVLDSNWRPDMDSHIILAAAQGHEYAREVEGDNGFHGVFTYSLLHTLRSENLVERLTYVDLLHAMPTSYYQTPVVAGCRINTRILYQD